MRTDTFKKLIFAIIVGIIFGTALSLGEFSKNGFANGLIQTLYSATLLGSTFFIGEIAFSKTGKNTLSMRKLAKKLDEDGVLVMSDISNMITYDGKNIKGWLYLTDVFLIFANNPDSELIEKKATKIPLSKIVSVDRFKPSPFTNDGIRVRLQKGNEYEVCVGKTQKWIDSIIEGSKKRSKRK
ncbi:hypothetical protein [Peptostreptococcus faecalis]|uniref:hypothetical protein n=1 Tax=Peptostreptococcus faecalis TaxID=2045015 RepID=UPI000C7CE1B4|nr:hypothetical protein [Peptostreptococcus faecalis]